MVPSAGSSSSSPAPETLSDAHALQMSSNKRDGTSEHLAHPEEAQSGS